MTGSLSYNFVHSHGSQGQLLQILDPSVPSEALDPSQEENETMPSPPDEQESYSCEPLGSLKLLFKINPGETTDTR